MINENANTYNTTNYGPASDTVDAALRAINTMSGITEKQRQELKQAMLEEIAAKERASKADIDTFSNEKGKARNAQFEDYIEGSIKENFTKSVDINNQKLSVEELKQSIELQKREAEAQMKIDRMFFDAELKLEKQKAEAGKYVASKLKYWAWRIFWPVLGAGAGVLAYVLMYILK